MNEKKPRDLAAHIRAAVDALEVVAAEAEAPTKSPRKKPKRRA